MNFVNGNMLNYIVSKPEKSPTNKMLYHPINLGNYGKGI